MSRRGSERSTALLAGDLQASRRQLLVDQRVDDVLWIECREHFSEMALIEVLMLAGFYRTVSYLTNALRLPLESYGARFPDASEAC